MDHLLKKRILITGGLGYIGSETFKMVRRLSEKPLSMIDQKFPRWKFDRPTRFAQGASREGIANLQPKIFDLARIRASQTASKEYSSECLAIDKLADPVRNTARASAPEGPMGRAVSNGADASYNVQSLDLKDAAKTSKVISDFKPDVIIHCATHSALAYRDHLSNSFQEDFSATVNILNALAGMPDCRLIYLSSSYVYSGLPANHNYDESSPLAPKHNFGIAKSFFEQFILKIHPNTVIFRLCSVFGSGQALHPNVILTFAEECLKSNSLTVWGRGERKLQYIYMKDVVNTILRSVGLASGIYNLGGDDYISVRDTATDIAKFFSVKVDFLENKPEGETLPFLSNQKIKNIIKNNVFSPFSIALGEYLKSLNILTNYESHRITNNKSSYY